MPKPKKTGRPSSFNQSLASRIFELAKSGKTDDQIADCIGISRSTLNNWKGRHPGFLDALKKAKRVADDLVEASLFQRAIGYSHPAVKFFFDSKEGVVISQNYTEHYPPDTAAAIFWLKNRRRNRWRDRPVESPPVTINNNASASLDSAINELKSLIEAKDECSRQTPPLSLDPPPGLLAPS